MKKRILLLTTLAAMLAASMALSGVVQAAPIGDAADAKCAKLARQTLGSGYNPSNYTFIGGTEDNDWFTLGSTAGPDVICGFGGDDAIYTLDEGDIFLGGAGTLDGVTFNSGTFYGGAGTDIVDYNLGTFYGGADNDIVLYNSDTFYGEEGDDNISETNDYFGTFWGGAGNDNINYNYGGFYGEEGNDTVGAGTGYFEQ